jgi:ABC-type siderophore export system fused ATPase/permease subunit
MDPSVIIDGVIPYLDYLSAPIFIFCSLAIADYIVGFVLELMKKVGKETRSRRS